MNKLNHHAQQIGDFNELPDPDHTLHPAQYVQYGYDSIS